MLDIISKLDPAGSPERCGLILKDGTVIEIDNLHEQPVLGFRMDPEQLLASIEDAAATWHTHPGGDPNLSEEDYAGFLQWKQLVHHIVGVRGGEPTVATFRVVAGLVIAE